MKRADKEESILSQLVVGGGVRRISKPKINFHDMIEAYAIRDITSCFDDQRHFQHRETGQRATFINGRGFCGWTRANHMKNDEAFIAEMTRVLGQLGFTLEDDYVRA